MRFSPDITVAEAAFSVANKVAMREPNCRERRKDEKIFLVWNPSPLEERFGRIFAAPIAIPRMSLSSVNEYPAAEFSLNEGDMTLTVPQDYDVPLWQDSWAKDILEEFVAIYEAHPHALCFRAVRLARMHNNQRKRAIEEARQLTMQGHISQMYSGGKIHTR